MNDAVSADMRKVIIDRLNEIAAEENVQILFAIESGSRAWGFHSPDSDYDVRFVYARPVDWHLTLGKKRDVIERPIDDELDLSGWELSKALTLALSSNAVIGEWLQSPIRYHEAEGAIADLTNFSRRALTRKSVTWHYLSMLRRQQRRLINPDGSLRLKRYFYALRPTLALRWVRLHDQPMPPMAMADLVQGVSLSDQETDALERMTILKKKAREKAEVAASDPLLDALILQETEAAEEWLSTAGKEGERQHLWDEANRIHRHYTQSVCL